jgi:NADPH:quinone reductase-like Zn-dependent oxidoreductase
MRAIPVNYPGGANSLKITEFKTPVCKNDEVLIEVKAFGLNFADIMARNGLYQDAPPMPFTPGYEVSGIVKETGENVKNFKKGDKVLAFVLFGGYAEYAVANELLCFHLPEDMTYAQGASIPVNFLTAYHCLFNTGTLFEGSKVLIQAAAGGVGLAAVQLAKIRKCVIFGTAGSQAKLDLLKGWGVDYPINYNMEDFEKVIMQKTEGKGIDLALDSLGGSSLKKCLNILKPHGRVASFGVSSLSQRGGLGIIKVLPEVLQMLTINVIDMLKKSKGFYGVNMLWVAKENTLLCKNDMETILQYFKEGKLKTIISKEYPWEKISEAHKEIESRSSTGKIILTIN